MRAFFPVPILLGLAACWSTDPPEVSIELSEPPARPLEPSERSLDVAKPEPDAPPRVGGPTRADPPAAPSSASPRQGTVPTQEAPARIAEARPGSVRAALDDPTEFIRTLRAVPVNGASGQPEGFRISGIQRGTLPHRLGFRSGDVVMAIDERPVRNLAEVMSIVQRLEDPSVSKVAVKIRRERAERVVVVDLNEPAP
ncbi:MAG: hypothetical protein EA397_19680 [Deltaproteobacteria bacterium]|nr:MAG: hypothetical protein EA397_19680 [Deltaproteobacteria bacterium]